ncbi:MAG: type II secretion system ATPase GspE [Candidatus Tectomicrobia bacterium]|nr:type II secretion system ATPase GspE [Candidatus Tectomicrobia bacterium]
MPLRLPTAHEVSKALGRLGRRRLPGGAAVLVGIPQADPAGDAVLQPLELAEKLGYRRCTAAEFPSSPIIVNELPLKFLKQHALLPLLRQGNRLTIAVADPADLHTFDALATALGCELEVWVCTRAEIEEALERSYGSGATTIGSIIQDLKAEEGEYDDLVDGDEAHLRDMASEAPVIRLVNHLITRAVEVGASDIHIEPFENGLFVRYRIDGILQDTEAPPARLQAAIISRVKIMARLNIAERRLPQDGRIRVRVAGREIDLRVSTVPTLYGESLVMRILDRSSIVVDLNHLGFLPDTLKQLEGLIRRPHGIILVTGPTGSGKTTTLYGALEKINTPEKKIITIEDPVEYQLNGVNQIHVKPQIGLTFANGLRSIVRQDPDVIMVGEIRDAETASIAIESALTGHLVLSTLHTNDSAGAITRLLDMGVEHFLVASSVVGIMAQRLVRLLCRDCRRADPPESASLSALGMPMEELAGAQMYQPNGCEACSHTGYRGRIGIFEMLLMTDEIRDLILQKTSSQIIKQCAMRHGMRLLRQDGWLKVKAGLTSIAEVLRVTQEE